MHTIDLNGTWYFRALPSASLPKRDGTDLRAWMKATVPGTVHTDLLALRKIPDPFHRMQENDVQWVEDQRWVYRREFEVPLSFLAMKRIELVAEGLDTYATLRCNGKLVGRTENMFVGHRFDVKPSLREGTNSIEISFDSPTRRSKALERTHGALRVILEPHRVYVRKAQYSFGWDWGPKLTTSGIWRDIRIEGTSDSRLRDPFVRVLSVKGGAASIRVAVDVEGLDRHRLQLNAFLTGPDTHVERQIAVTEKHTSFTIRIRNPKLWWPNGYGDQPLYRLLLSLADDGVARDALQVPFAIRTVRLLQERDREGKSFILEVNGKRIFCKGADWIPSDSFIPRIPTSTYERLLRLAREAHMNMIRVWGGGIYEQEIFYETCDRLGLMVWQDFMFACGEYPEEPWFRRLVRDEAEKVVKRLRNHPCIVVWCGNNECEWLFCTENPDKTPDDMRGATLFRDLLPAVCASLDGSRPYWRSTPFGDGFPNAESSGNHHQWHVWSGWRDYTDYEKDNARFVTEFGFQAPANRKTLDAVLLPADRRVQGKVMEHHNKQAEGTERLFRFLSAHHRVPESYDDFIYTCQLVQAEALKCAVEHWRRRKHETAGSLFWQLNDCWPVSSWSVIDSALRPKAGYYFAKRFFAPLLVSLQREGSGVRIWVTNDLMQRVDARLTVSLRSFEGKRIWLGRKSVILPPNASVRVHRVSLPAFPPLDRATHYVHAQLVVGGTVVSENRLFFEEPKHLILPRTSISVSISEDTDGMPVARLMARQFAKAVWLEIDGQDLVFEDNYFDMDAGETKEVRLGREVSLTRARRALHVRWLQ